MISLLDSVNYSQKELRNLVPANLYSFYAFYSAYPGFFNLRPYSDSPKTDKENLLDDQCRKHYRFWHRMTDGAYHVCDGDGCQDEIYKNIDSAISDDRFWW